MTINNVITWKNGNVGTDSTPLSADNLNKINTNTAEALSDLQKEIDNQITILENRVAPIEVEVKNIKEASDTAKADSESAVALANTALSQLNGYTIQVGSGGLDEGVIYFII